MPASSPEAPNAAQDLAFCRSLMRNGSRSFFAASHLLPRRIFEPASALYAFCRLADDAVDLGGARQSTVDALRQRLERAYAGAPQNNPVDRAFAATIARHRMPRALPLALLEGFEWDLQGRRYETIDDLFDYAARVAGSVGAMMAVLMGARGADALARACDLGVAMQLTNIARDVGEDARAGRLYLPMEWMREAGLSPEEWLRHPGHNAALASVIGRLLDRASRLYASGEEGIGCLPRACRPGIRAARLIYAEIGNAVARHGHDSVSHRARVPGSRKAVLLARSVAGRSHAARLQTPALPACLYLVDAALADRIPSKPAPFAPILLAPLRGVHSRATWTLDLFVRLREQQLETS